VNVVESSSSVQDAVDEWEIGGRIASVGEASSEMIVGGRTIQLHWLVAVDDQSFGDATTVSVLLSLSSSSLMSLDDG
jgi:hypothetical protein